MSHTNGYRKEGMVLPQHRARNRFTTHLAAAQALEAHDRIHRESTEIRARHGLPPVRPSTSVLAWRGKLVGR